MTPFVYGLFFGAQNKFHFENFKWSQLLMPSQRALKLSLMQTYGSVSTQSDNIKGLYSTQISLTDSL